MRRVLLLLLIPLSFTSLAAQDTLTAGDKVRVTTEEERVVGCLTAIEGDQLTLDTSLVFPLASLTKLEVSRGQKSKTGTGALIGLSAGAAVGVITGLALCSSESGECFSNGTDLTATVAVVLGVGGALGGVLIGALIGSSIKVDRWETVPLDRISVSLTPRGGGLEVSAKFVF